MRNPPLCATHMALSSNPKKSDMPEDCLQAPFLNGGQDEKCDVQCALVEPRGDVNASERPTNNKPSTFTNSGKSMHPDGLGNATDLLSCHISGEPETERLHSMHPNGRVKVNDSLSCHPSGTQEMETRIVQPPMPEAYGTRVGKESNERDPLAGLLPPVIEATGAEVVGIDIEWLQLQNK
jgi:hypothetical protein